MKLMKKLRHVKKIIGIKINMANYEMRFANRQKVVFENCIFSGGEKNTILFENCNVVEIHNCTFEKRTIIFESINIISIDGSKFNNCKHKYNSTRNDWERLGGVIYSQEPSNIGKIDIINSTFDSCGGINEAYYYRSAFISNIDSKVDNYTFLNCWHINGWNIDSEDKRRTMFTPASSATNCKYDNSAKFN